MPKYGYPSDGAKKGIASTGGSLLDLRVKLTDVGKLKTPAGAGAPSTKGSITPPKQVGKGSK